jgi:hypothetical protein
MGDGKARTLRLLVVWKGVEPTLGGPRSFSRLDGIVGNAAANGVRILPILTGEGPPGTQYPPTGRRSRKAFARFAAALAARYGRGGKFWTGRPYYRPIKAWQIQNEQNGRAYWGARPNPREYAKLLKAAARAIKTRDRRAEIVLGGMFGTPSGRGAMTAWDYLKRLYRVRGIKRSFSTVALHPYARGLRGIKEQIAKVRKVMRQHGDRRAGLRLTEIGWGSGPKAASPYNKGTTGQATMLRKLFGLLEAKRRAWKIKGVNWFAWRDNPGVPCSFCPTAGLFTEGGTAKPAWGAFKLVAF